MKFRLVTIITILIISGTILISGCGKSEESSSNNSSSSANNVGPLVTEMKTSDSDNDNVVDKLIITTTGGDISINLRRDAAPNTVAHIIQLADSGFYDKMWFLRAVPSFVIQIGDPGCRVATSPIVKKGDCDLKGGSASNGSSVNINGEVVPASVISHHRGSVSMGNTGTPDTADSQFFICLSDANCPTPFNGKYTIFGEVDSGIEIADAISNSIKTNPNSINAGTASAPDYRLFVYP